MAPKRGGADTSSSRPGPEHERLGNHRRGDGRLRHPQRGRAGRRHRRARFQDTRTSSLLPRTRGTRSVRRTTWPRWIATYPRPRGLPRAWWLSYQRRASGQSWSGESARTGQLCSDHSWQHAEVRPVELRRHAFGQETKYPTRNICFF